MSPAPTLPMAPESAPTRACVGRGHVRTGALVAGAYEIEHLLGQGASGDVWAARNTASGLRVALKVLTVEAATHGETVERFRREALFLARAQSPHVARIHDFVRDPVVGMALVMELVEGEPLACFLERRTLTVEEAIELGVDLLAGVEAMHAARVIHRDLKPGNVLLRVDAYGRPRPVICDFGLSRLSRRRDGESVSAVSLTELTRGDVAMGTLHYMAPEQVLDARKATERSDLYAVGAILFRAVTGVHAFGEHEEARQVARAKVMGEAPPFETGRIDLVGRGLARVVTRALRRRPAERHRDAAEMKDELVRLRELARAATADTQPTSQMDPLAWDRTVGLPDVGARIASAALAAPTKRWTSRAAMAVGVFLGFVVGVAAGRVWALDAPSVVQPVKVSVRVQPPRIEGPQMLTDIAELPTTTNPAAAIPTVALPVLTIASLPRGAGDEVVEATAKGDGNPY